jgi:hypothetical protein
MSFESLKKSRSNAISKLVNAAESIQSSKKTYGDDRFWKPTVDKSGNGYAVIRFLPTPDGEELPWARYWDHGFQGPTGRWYIEKSLTSIGKPDPVSDHNTKLWNSGVESDKELVRKRKRRLHYVSNIYVVSDSSNPENDGKVFLFEYGKKIFEKLMEAMQPQFADEEPVNPFDMWEGADFKLKIRTVEGYRNYDRSEFAKAEPLSDNDDELKEIYSKVYSLKEYSDPNNYKTYEELNSRLELVLGESRNLPIAESISLGESHAPKSISKVVSDDGDEDDLDYGDDDGDDNTLSYFAKLAQED